MSSGSKRVCLMLSVFMTKQELKDLMGGRFKEAGEGQEKQSWTVR